MKRIYIYLAKRNKKGIKLLVVLSDSNNYPATKIADATKIGLSPELQSKISKQAHEDRMLWELWIESASDFADLKHKLTKRGHTELPMFASPLFNNYQSPIVEEIKKQNLINPAKEQKSMIRKFKN